MAIILATAKQLSEARSCEVESSIGVIGFDYYGEDVTCFMLRYISAAQSAKDGLWDLQQQQW